MNKIMKISNYQLTTLIICFMLGSSIIVNPAASAKQDGWMAFLLGWSGGLCLVLIYTWIALLNPGKSLIAILKDNFGKIPGSILSVCYILYFIHLAALVLRNFVEFTITVNYPETPITFIGGCLMLVVLYAVKKNIEVIGRLSEIFAVVLNIVLIFVFFALFSMYEFSNLKPFFEYGLYPIVKAGYSTLTFPFGETVAFLMIFPFVKDQNKLKKSAAAAVAIAGTLLFTAIIRNQMVLGTDMISRDVFPSHVVFRLIPGMDVDPLLDLNFTMGGIIKTSICLYGAITGLAELLHLDNYKTLALPMSAFVMAFSLWLFDNLTEMLSWANDIWPYYSMPFQIIIPVLLLVVSMIRQKRNKAEKQNEKAT